MGVSKRIAIRAQPSTPSELPASRQYSLADAFSMILNDSAPENLYSADSDSGEEIDTQVESPFDSNPTVSLSDGLVGLVVRCPPRERKVQGSNPACSGIFPGSSHTSDLNIGTPVATLPGAWHYRVSPATGRPGVSIL